MSYVASGRLLRGHVAGLGQDIAIPSIEELRSKGVRRAPIVTTDVDTSTAHTVQVVDWPGDMPAIDWVKRAVTGGVRNAMAVESFPCGAVWSTPDDGPEGVYWLAIRDGSGNVGSVLTTSSGYEMAQQPTCAVQLASSGYGIEAGPTKIVDAGDANVQQMTAMPPAVGGQGAPPAKTPIGPGAKAARDRLAAAQANKTTSETGSTSPKLMSPVVMLGIGVAAVVGMLGLTCFLCGRKK